MHPHHSSGGGAAWKWIAGAWAVVLLVAAAVGVPLGFIYGLDVSAPVDSSASGQTTCSYRTQTQGGWGTTCSGGNPGCYRDAKFAACFGCGISIGCGPMGNWLKFTNSTAVKNFLPKGGSPSTLGAKLTNPASSAAGTDGVFAGQLLTAKLNVGFDACDASFSSCSRLTSSLCFTNSGPNPTMCNGYTVAEVIVAADNIIGGCGTVACKSVAPAALCGLSPASLSTCLDVFNNNFDGGTINKGNVYAC